MQNPYFNSDRFIVEFPEKLGFQKFDVLEVKNIKYNFNINEWEPIVLVFRNTFENFIYKKLIDFIYYIRNQQIDLPIYIKIDLLNQIGEIKTRFLLEVDECSFIHMGDLNIKNNGDLNPSLTFKPNNIKIENFD